MEGRERRERGEKGEGREEREREREVDGKGARCVANGPGERWQEERDGSKRLLAGRPAWEGWLGERVPTRRNAY